jgi:hypothetical protein
MEIGALCCNAADEGRAFVETDEGRAFIDSSFFHFDPRCMHRLPVRCHHVANKKYPRSPEPTYY